MPRQSVSSPSLGLFLSCVGLLLSIQLEISGVGVDGWGLPSFTKRLPPPPPPNISEAIAPAPLDNVNASQAHGNSLADMLDRVLEKEFSEAESTAGTEEVSKSFNSSADGEPANLEKVAKVTHDKGKRNKSESDQPSKPFQLQDLIGGNHDEGGGSENPILIDSEDNVFIISNPKGGYMVLQQDIQFISDLVIVIVSGAFGGVLCALLNQPVMTGYLLAGSAIGPGGLKLVGELVQVESVAQFGVVFLLFTLGMEFSLSKLRTVRAVAITGGVLQILLFMLIAGVTAMVSGAGTFTMGLFVGACISISSSAVVIKGLVEKSALTSIHGQVVLGTLVMQDIAVALLFAVLSILGASSTFVDLVPGLLKLVLALVLFVTTALLLGRRMGGMALKYLVNMGSSTPELQQLAVLAFCLAMAWASGALGLSMELGAFIAGVAISATDQVEQTMHQVEAVRNLFVALFLTSIGLVLNPAFLWSHLDILLMSFAFVLVCKLVFFTVVIRAFGIRLRSAIVAAVAMAQIGELAFVLLNRASNLHFIPRKVYLLLLGTTALSLITTPVFSALMPVILRVMRLKQEVEGTEGASKGPLPSKVDGAGDALLGKARISPTISEVDSIVNHEK